LVTPSLIPFSLTYWRVADYKTDTIIQTSLRNELKGDVTLITVAHRLQTIIDADKVVRGPSQGVPSCKTKEQHNISKMVLDTGRIVSGAPIVI
jgi:ABC-type transport system involved in cytochrome bd biosynthesis fused ATPase/permease subunit